MPIHEPTTDAAARVLAGEQRPLTRHPQPRGRLTILRRSVGAIPLVERLDELVVFVRAEVREVGTVALENLARIPFDGLATSRLIVTFCHFLVANPPPFEDR